MKTIVLGLLTLVLMSSVSAYYVSLRDNAFVPAYSIVGIAAGRQVIRTLGTHPRQVTSDEVRGSNFRPETFYMAWGVQKGRVMPKESYMPTTVMYDHTLNTQISNAEQREINPLDRTSGAYIGRYGLEKEYIKTFSS